MPPEDTRPDKRHEDFNNLNDLIAKGVKSIMLSIVPLMVIGVFALIANYFETRNTKTEVEKLNIRMESTSEKVQIMWYGGDWPKKYREELHARQ